MPTFKEEILMMLSEGAFYLLNLRALFSIGLLCNYSSLRKTINRLEKDGLVRKETREWDIFLHLTNQGKLFLEKHREGLREFPHSWDHRWRVVIFDIPEKRGDVRLYLRRFLKTLGFGKVQKSVWISPYNFEKQVREFAYKLDIPRCIFQLTVERFSGLNGRELAGSFWDIPGLEDRYQRLIQLYSKQIASLQAAADDTLISRKRFISNLTWDYHSILAQDPQLPDELLPADWSGSSAKQFVAYCYNTFSPNIH